MKIRGIGVTRLFERFNHNIILKDIDPITIIHGPNGYGKTTILNLLAAILKLDHRALTRTSFKSVELSYDDGNKLLVEKTSRKVEERRRTFKQPFIAEEITYSLINKKGKKEEEFTPNLDIPPETERHWSLSSIQVRFPELRRISARQWVNRSTNEIVNYDDLLESYGHQLALFGPKEKSEWLDKLIQSTPVHYVRTQRLFLQERRKHYEDEPDKAPFISTVQKHSEELADTIQQKLAQSVALSQSLDQAFPNKLLTEGPPPNVTEASIREMYDEQGKKRLRLMAAGLLQTEQEIALPQREMDETEKRVLWFYNRDVEAKLGVFDETLSRIELFKEIINDHFLYKNVQVDKNTGFIITSKEGIKLPPTVLSSGEQHELILAYELLFNVKTHSLILVDEPELSLHVVWQQKFLQNIQKISGLTNCYFLIATHSPQIIHNRWDLAVELKGPEN